MYTHAGPDLKLRLFWLAIGYLLVVLVIVLSLASIPVDMEASFPYEDKVYHAFAYFTLMAWFAQVYHDSSRRIMFALIFIMLGVLLEFLQSFTADRFFEFGDMVANTTGVALGFAVTLTGIKNYLVKIESLFF